MAKSTGKYALVLQNSGNCPELSRGPALFRKIAIASFAAMLAAGTASAQTSRAPEVTDAVVSAPIETRTGSGDAVIEEITNAVAHADEVTSRIKIMTNANRITVVRVPAPDAEAMNELPGETQARITQLQEALSLNAILAYALDSEQVAMKDVLAAEVSDQDEVTIYVRSI